MFATFPFHEALTVGGVLGFVAAAMGWAVWLATPKRTKEQLERQMEIDRLQNEIDDLVARNKVKTLRWQLAKLKQEGAADEIPFE